MRCLLTRMLLASCIACGAFAVSTPARADIFYSFDPASGSGQNLSMNLDAGASTNLSIFLVFTGTDATNLTTEKGLFSADIDMLRIGALPSQPVGIANAAAVQGNTLFDDPAGPLITFTSSGDVDLLQTVSPLDVLGVAGTPFGSGSQSIKLGNFTFTAGAIVGQSTTFQAQDTPVFNDTITFTNSLILDNRIGTAKVTFNTTSGGPGGGAVPLPAAFWSGLLLMAGIAASFGINSRTYHVLASF